MFEGLTVSRLFCVSEYAERIAAAAPPLTPDQRNLIASLLAGGEK